MSAPARQQRAVAIEPKELEQMLRQDPMRWARELLPAGREECGYWRVGSIAGEPGQSLAVNLNGAMRGCWTDFSAPDKTRERGGDMLWLIACVLFGGRLADAISWAISKLGLDGLDPDRLKKEKAKARKAARDADEAAAIEAEKKRARAKGLYLSATPIAGTIAETYLIARGIDLRAAGLIAPGSLKFAAAVYCAEAKRKLPCLVAAMVNLDGQHVSTHRTWLQQDGSDKAALIEPRKAMGAYKGAFIPVWKGAHDVAMGRLPAGTPILVSEGIEDALSAAIARPHHRVIAAVSLSNMGSLILPANAGPIVILGQRDLKQRAIDSLDRAIGKLQDKGHDVRCPFPPVGVNDWNDLLRLPDGALGDLIGGDGANDD